MLDDLDDVLEDLSPRDNITPREFRTVEHNVSGQRLTDEPKVLVVDRAKMATV